MKSTLDSFWTGFGVSVGFHLALLVALFVGGAIAVSPVAVHWRSIPVEIVGREALEDLAQAFHPQEPASPPAPSSSSPAPTSNAATVPLSPTVAPPASSRGVVSVLVSPRGALSGYGVASPAATNVLAGAARSSESAPVPAGASGPPGAATCGAWPFPCLTLPMAPPTGLPPWLERGGGATSPCAALLTGGATSGASETCPLARALRLLGQGL